MKNAGRPMAALLIGLLLLVSIPQLAKATTTQEKLNQAKQEKKQTESALKQTNAHITGMQGEKESLQGQLSILNGNLMEVSENLEKLESDIKGKESEIETTKQELEAAQEKVAWQYDCMKKRIKFIYERSNNAYMEMMLQSKSFGEFLNKSHYVEELAEYDRNMLIQFQEIQSEIEAQKQKLETEKKELDEMKEKTEEEKKKVAGMVRSTSNNIAGYADQIAAAEGVADAYEAQIKEQEQNIAALQKKLAEEQAMSRLAARSAKRNISEVTFAEGDRELLANLIYCEAGGEPYAGKVAVGAVVINRLLSSVYPDTMVGVIYQNRQFSPVASGRLSLALTEGRATSACYQAADEAMAGHTNVGNCVYFRTPIPGLTGIAIGGHIFY